MTYWQKVLRLLLHYREVKAQAEVDRIGALQETAKRRRAELAAEQERAAQTTSAASQTTLAVSRKRVTEAEAAYAMAIQLWDDKQFRR